MSFELAKKVVLEPVAFATSDLVTPSFKLKRHDAKAKYLPIIEILYAEKEDRSKDKWEN